MKVLLPQQSTSTGWDEAVVDLPEPDRDPDPTPATRPGWSGRPVLEAIALVPALVLCLGLPLLSWSDAAVPGRPVLAVLFVLLVPGVPAVIALRPPDGRVATILAVTTGPAVLLVTGTLTTSLHRWSPAAAASIQAAIGVLFLPAAVHRVLQSAPTAPWRAALRAIGRRVRGLCVLAGSVLLWWAATRTTDLTAAGDRGILTVLPWTYWLALVLVCAVITAGLVARAVDHLLLGIAVPVLLIQVATFVGVASGAAPVGAGWVQVGFVEYIARTGEVALGTDARFSWPGFLAGSAQLQQWAGMSSVGPLMVLAPGLFAVLAMPALWLIGRAVTRSARGGWIAVLLFGVTNWLQQDYFSSQAVAFLFFVSILAVLLGSLSAARLPLGPGWRRCWQVLRRVPGRPAGLGAGRMLALEGALLLLIAAMVMSHQLTPVVTVLALLVFAITGTSRFRTLPVAAGVLFLGWFGYGATDYWTGHLGTVLGDVGRVGSTVSAGVGQRLTGDPVYLQMQYLRMGWTALLLLLAVAGWWLLRRRPEAVLLAGLAACPIGLVALQSYGGEVVIRVALYGGPIWAALGAVALLRLGRAFSARRRRVAVLASGVALVVAAGIFTTTRGLNVAFERVSAVQVAAAQELLDLVPLTSSIGVLESVGPLPMARLGEVRVVQVDPTACGDSPADCEPDELPGYWYLTSGMDALGALQEGRPVGWTRQIVAELLATGDWVALIDTTEVTVLARAAA
ncbi:serine/threonine protein kinase [Nakamurella sp. YIM 132087]|uniref:Serine/threonine protein kinase n=1 Tax=Nakamurella alba TaxID=2665158 RepID=A0A7K1FL66_9ACTN|nr:serine/threonine protein kinase [Nakamurella alba]MTD14892.1 serine/threonine protein kinase [Nakamurella alba]